MNEQTDQELLRDYAAHRSEPAFTELVRRHIDLVHSAAVRMVCDAHLAQDVTQATFVALAQNANHLTDRAVLSGWLHRTAQNLASKTIRTDVRRRSREQEAVAMNDLLSAHPEVSWEQIAPHLDAALSELNEPERDAVLLRYFENKSAAEIGSTLGISSEAAQKRVSRAVERLRESFAKRGVTVGAGGLVVIISANAVQAAPVGLAVTISAAALVGTAATTSTLIAATTKTIAMTTLQKTLVTATVAVLVGTGLVGVWTAKKGNSEKPTEEFVKPAAQVSSDPAKPNLAAKPTVSYSIENIPIPPGFSSVHVNSFNNQGQVVGSLDGSNGCVHAFVWDNGEMTDLESFGGSKAIACSINDMGEITTIVLTNNQRRILLLQTNGLTDLGAIDEFAKLGLEGNTYYAPSVSINNRSEVTCRLTIEDGNQRSFLFRQGKISYFGLRGDGSGMDTRAMNNQGDIVGVTIPGNEGWGVFVWRDGKMTDLKTLGGPRAGANAINDHGTTVGWANPAGATWDQAHAIVWANGELHDLNASGWKNSRAVGINNTGDVVGWATKSDGKTLCFLKRGEMLLDLNDLLPTNSGWRIVGVSSINERGQILAQARKDDKTHPVIISPPDLQHVATTKPAISLRTNTALPRQAQLSITTFTRLPNGAFHLRFNGQPGINYMIEASTNLRTWEVLGEAKNLDGQIEFTDHEAPNYPLRFYRVAQP